MKFGPIPTREAIGAVLAHSVRAADLNLKKGTLLTAAHVEALIAAAITEIIVARLEPGDLPEDEAAARLLAAILPDPGACGASISAPFTGRANAFAAHPGLLQVDTAAVHAFNRIHEAITLATLPDQARVTARQMIATVKIIPYAAPRAAVEAAEALLRELAVLRVHPRRLQSASLYLTQTPGMKPSLIEKGRRAVEDRLTALGLTLAHCETLPHQAAPLAQALRASPGDLVLVLAGSATSDRRDVVPSAIEAAGGAVERLGMPVDPGNLLVLGEIGARPVVGLPGCVRSPKLNGADWVLERLVHGERLHSDDIAAMGAGGLLKEIASRPQPRADGTGEAAGTEPLRPFTTGVLLAAGASSRMGEGRHKLLERLDGEPLLRRSAKALLASPLDEVIIVLGAREDEMRAALEGLPLRIVTAAEWRLGMAHSLRAGLQAASGQADAVLVALADMPGIDAQLIARLLAGFDPEEGREIIRPVAASGPPGQPVLFGRRFFEALLALSGDNGARSVLAEHPEFVTDIAVADPRQLADLDTPEAWSAWRRGSVLL